MVHLYLDRLDAAVRAPSSHFLGPNSYISRPFSKMFHFPESFFSNLFSKILWIADEMPYGRLCQHVKVEFARDLADVLDGAVLIQNVDGRLGGMVGMVRGDALQQHEACIIQRELVMCCDGVKYFVPVSRVERLLGDLNTE